MKKMIPCLLLFLSACSHTQEENYTMIDKVVNELGTIKDSISYLDSTIVTSIPAAKFNINEDTSKGIRFRKFYVDSLTNTPDSIFGIMLGSYNRLQERFYTYQDIYGRIFKRLPTDSVETNRLIQDRFEATIKQ